MMWDITNYFLLFWEMGKKKFTCFYVFFFSIRCCLSVVNFILFSPGFIFSHFFYSVNLYAFVDEQKSEKIEFTEMTCLLPCSRCCGLMYECVGVSCFPTESMVVAWGYRALSVGSDTDVVCGCQFVSITDINLESMETLCAGVYVFPLTWVIEFHGLVFQRCSVAFVLILIFKLFWAATSCKSRSHFPIHTHWHKHMFSFWKDNTQYGTTACDPGLEVWDQFHFLLQGFRSEI